MEAAVVKRTYAIGAGGRLSLADEQVPLTEEPEVELDGYGGHKLLLDDTDLGPPKIATDVVFTGSACAEGRASEPFTALVVGNVARRLRVTGERRGRRSRLPAAAPSRIQGESRGRGAAWCPWPPASTKTSSTSASSR